MTPEIVDGICAREGVAAATRQLYDFVRESHGAFIRSIDETRPFHASSGDTIVAIAPAALYKEYRGSGADGRRVREAASRLGLRTEIIPLAPSGTLDENAAILVDWLRNSPHENVILVSLSKGSSDIKRALITESNHDAFRSVSSWISIGGLLNGTPLARWLLSDQRFPKTFRALNRIRGIDFGFIAEVDRYPGGPLDCEFTLPPHMQLIHVLGFPLPEHANNWLARILYRKLAVDGPNDAFMLLKDALCWPGVIYPVWGADHYFRSAEDPAPLLERLLASAVRRPVAACEVERIAHGKDLGEEPRSLLGVG